jgi:hypothetical protein
MSDTDVVERQRQIQVVDIENNDDDTRSLSQYFFLEQDMAVLSRTITMMTRQAALCLGRSQSKTSPALRQLPPPTIAVNSFTFQHSAHRSSLAQQSRNPYYGCLSKVSMYPKALERLISICLLWLDYSYCQYCYSPRRSTGSNVPP